jgi:hypothetical protein
MGIEKLRLKRIWTHTRMKNTMIHGIRSKIIKSGFMINESIVLNEGVKCVSILMIRLSAKRVEQRATCMLSFDAYSDEEIYMETLLNLTKAIEDKVKSIVETNSDTCLHTERMSDADLKHIYCADCGKHLGDHKYIGLEGFTTGNN